MKKSKREVTDAQFKNQAIFIMKGMQANLRKIYKMFPEGRLPGIGCIMDLEYTIRLIKKYRGCIVRKPPWSSNKGVVAKRGATLKGSAPLSGKDVGSHYDMGVCDDITTEEEN